jgi:hypothetical protein
LHEKVIIISIMQYVLSFTRPLCGKIVVKQLFALQRRLNTKTKVAPVAVM